jgi:hypothetical protein
MDFLASRGNDATILGDIPSPRRGENDEKITDIHGFRDDAYIAAPPVATLHRPLGANAEPPHLDP